MHRSRLPHALAAALVFATPFAARLADADAALPERLAAAVAALEPVSRTGVLVDRVLPVVDLARLDGGDAAPALDAAAWRQSWDELQRSTVRGTRGASAARLAAEARTAAPGTIPLALFDVAYERVRPEAVHDGTLAIEDGRIVRAGAGALVAGRAFAATALVSATHRGGALAFTLAPDHVLADAAPRAIACDFADGRGFRTVVPGTTVRVAYAATGVKTLALRATRADGSVATSRFTLDVRALATPAPNDTLHVTAKVAYQGVYGTGDAYVDLAPGHAQVENPVVVIEGFDLDNSMNWDELYALLNRENLLEDLRADGFDVVVLNFTDATRAVQQNGFVVEALVEQVQSMIAPTRTLALVGASMGGLCSRYALAWMEHSGVPHRVRLFMSFDSPHAGADIPLGLQYWIDFFASQSTDAAAFLAALNSPAARQMLVYHYTSPPGTTGQPDPMRATMTADFAAVGDWPQLTRRVAVANGSGTKLNQGFAPADQCIRWEYSSLFAAITGDVWALPDQSSATIFKGSTRVIFSTTSRNVAVSGTRPWDGAPGGYRTSFADLDAVSAPYGDIVALHPNHCFVPTISSLSIATSDPFYDVLGDPALVSHTPFDALFVPTTNEEHVLVTPGNAAWAKAEVEAGILAAPVVDAAPSLHLTAGPNPFTGGTRLAFTLPAATRAELALYDATGREVRVLAHGTQAAGHHEFAWDARDQSGHRVRAGVYFARLEAAGKVDEHRIVALP